MYFNYLVEDMDSWSLVWIGCDTSTYIYIKSTTVYVPALEMGLNPTPSNASECAPPAGKGLGESQFRRLEKKLSSLFTLWDVA
jgi:hypothetical protein